METLSQTEAIIELMRNPDRAGVKIPARVHEHVREVSDQTGKDITRLVTEAIVASYGLPK